MDADNLVLEQTLEQPLTPSNKKKPKKLTVDNAILGLNSKELEIKRDGIFTVNTEQSASINDEGNLTKVYIILTFILAFSIFIFAASVNPEVFKLQAATSKILNQAINSVVLLVVPFLFGVVGALTRIILTDLKIKQKGMLIISSGLMAMVSWVAIKSDILFSTQALHSIDGQVVSNLVTVSELSGFYSSSLIAIVVGMLVTNFYVSFLARIELQLARSKHAKPEHISLS